MANYNYRNQFAQPVQKNANGLPQGVVDMFPGAFNNQAPQQPKQAQVIQNMAQQAPVAPQLTQPQPQAVQSPWTHPFGGYSGQFNTAPYGNMGQGVQPVGQPQQNAPRTQAAPQAKMAQPQMAPQNSVRPNTQPQMQGQVAPNQNRLIPKGVPVRQTQRPKLI